MKSDCNATILLDIDGVLSPLTSSNEDSIKILSDWGNWLISESIVELLYCLSFTGVKVMWISSHEETSNNIMRSLELPDLDYIEFEENTLGWPKQYNILETVKRILANEGPDHKIMIIDDEIPVSLQLELQTLRVLTLVPDGRYGLLKEDVAAIRKFLF